MRERHQKEVNEFPMSFAFSDKQFEEGMEKLGLKPTDTDKVCSIGMGGFTLKENCGKLEEMFDKHNKEIKTAMNDDNFAYDAFYYELGNHEYVVTYDSRDALGALGFSTRDINNNTRLRDILSKACKDQQEWYDKNG
jgi:hypothetical protein